MRHLLATLIVVLATASPLVLLSAPASAATTAHTKVARTHVCQWHLQWVLIGAWWELVWTC